MKNLCYLKNIILFVSLILLAGCGFHLRSAESLPPEFHTIYLQTANEYGEFEVTFKRALKASGVVVTDDIDQAKLRLILTSNYNYTTTSAATSNQARVYSLTYLATIYATDKNGKTILKLKSTSVTRSVALAPDEVYESSNQITIVKHEMQQELVNRLFNILSSQQTFNELAT